MRILLINPNTTQAVTDLVADHVRGHIRAMVGGAAEIVPVTGRFGARYIASRAASVIAGHSALDALAEHVAGCDAVYLACFGDPGLMALREVSPVPVVGMAEAACRAAAAAGRRFAIVTGGALWAPMLTEFVVGLGLSDRLSGVRTVAPTGGEIAADPEAALGQLAAACRACAEVDGAKAVILGGAALAGLAARIQPAVPVPVLCSVEAGTRAVLAAAGTGEARGAAPALASIGLAPALAALLAGA
ncbi:aspartate/glutamate racemase family protein [Methylobacterium sp. J-090]|uniref:aspartate/glutamate racemase family protein n=1 Tax=Methylobacterium sp. J-090 TaxID=2836666 RepID=UPI001FB9D314|nr:aspartate/glutamate racemase family protein [Methylobacterium sp. J-090]MCJ2079690.1 aspartate/glutamate racemase family protein [Methylobacterium sp. J-090]